MKNTSEDNGNLLSQSNYDQPPEKSFFIGRWQPLHEGHIRLIRTVLDEGREVVIGIMVTPLSKRNPYNDFERAEMFREEFRLELQSHQMTLLTMPWIDEVCYGRAVGWRCRRIHLAPETESICGSEERQKAGAV